MKKMLLLFAMIIMSNMLFGQMNYQFVLLDANDDPLDNETISVQFKIRAGSATGTIVYQETHESAVLTDDFGRASVVIGSGTPVIGTYDGIDRTGDHFLDVEVDINGGTNYQPFTNSEIFPAFKADEIDPVYSAGPASDITQADIDNWNNPPTSSVIALDEDNYLNVSVYSDDVIDVRERIDLTTDYSKLNKSNLFITGGEFKGTGSETITFGSQSVISNIKFDNVKVAGSNITFINCYFYYVDQLPSNSTFNDGEVRWCDFTTSTYGCSFTNIDVEDISIPRVKSFAKCNIWDCTIGNTSYTLPKCSNNIIDDCTIYVSENFSNNDCENTNLIINDNVYFININGNKFDEELSSGTKIITINRNTNSYHNQVKIANNFFWGDASSSVHIQINGTYTNGGIDSIVHIIGNTFAKGANVIEDNSSEVKIIFSNNIRNQVSNWGIDSSDSDVYMNYNIHIL